MTTAIRADVRRPTSVIEAATILADAADDGEALAGGTWVMRGCLRGELPKRLYVQLGAIPELRGVEEGGDTVSLGALLTHTELARLGGASSLCGLREAAAISAFPQIRNVATLGGNLCAKGFAEADLVPALLAADARVELTGPTGSWQDTVEQWLVTDAAAPVPIVRRFTIPAPAGRRSAFERLTVRVSGEYAIANVAVSADIDEGGVIRAARVAVGGVEQVARLCTATAEALVGQAVRDPALAEEAMRRVAEECVAREGHDAPGWYRLAVLPSLLRRAVARLDHSQGA
jgi:carbon-monoxide dehydrogenase medium subunit